MLKAGGVCRNSEHRSRQELHAHTTGLHSRDVGVNAVQFRLNWSLRTLSGSWQSTQRGMGLSSIWMCRYNMLLGILSFSQRWKPYFHSAEWNSNFSQKFIVRKDTRQGRDPEIKVPQSLQLAELISTTCGISFGKNVMFAVCCRAIGLKYKSSSFPSYTCVTHKLCHLPTTFRAMQMSWRGFWRRLGRISMALRHSVTWTLTSLSGWVSPSWTKSFLELVSLHLLLIGIPRRERWELVLKF